MRRAALLAGVAVVAAATTQLSPAPAAAQAQPRPTCPAVVAGVELDAAKAVDEERLAAGVDGVQCSYLFLGDGERAVGNLVVNWHFAERGDHVMFGTGACSDDTSYDGSDSVFAIASPDRQVTSDGRWTVTVDRPYQQTHAPPDEARRALTEMVRAAQELALPCASSSGSGSSGSGSDPGTAGAGSAASGTAGAGTPASREALLVGAGLIMLLLGGAPPVLRRLRGQRSPTPRGASLALPESDAYGERLVVQDGTYEGGEPGDVWWDGEWIGPDQALDEIRAQEEAIRRRDLERDAFWSDSSARNREEMRELVQRGHAEADGERAAREREHAASEARERLERREEWSHRREQLLDEHRSELERAESWGRWQRGAEWVLWGADRGIDVLAHLTGPAGKTVQSSYVFVKNVGAGASEATVTGDPTKVVDGAVEGLLDLAFSRYVSRSAPLDRAFGAPLPSAFPAINPDQWRNVAVSRLARIATNPSGYRWSSEALRAAGHNAGHEYLREAVVRDPVKNLLQGAREGRSIPPGEGRDALTRHIREAARARDALLGDPTTDPRRS